MFKVSVSPCSTPQLSLDEFCAACADMGYRRVELFTNWTGAILDCTEDPAVYQAALKRYAMVISSIHLPAFSEDLETSVAAVRACIEFAGALSIPVGILHGTSRKLIIDGTQELLKDAPAGIRLVVTNHAGTPVASIEEFREVLDGIDDDRIQGLLEVGHFHTEGIDWPEGYDLLKGRIGLVHIKDQIGSQSVPFGTGEINLRGLFGRLMDDGYSGDVVVEMEVADKENTLDYLQGALQYIQQALNLKKKKGMSLGKQ